MNARPEPAMRMHDDELEIDADLVTRLLREQFPQLAGRVPRLIRSTGTVNAIYRLGDDLYVRLPRQTGGDDLEREFRWLPRLAPHLPLPVPEPVGLGQPSSEFGLHWAVYRWLDGQPYADGLVDEEQAADDLATFVHALRRVDPTGAPRGGRRPLLELDAGTRDTITACAGVIDHHAALTVWDEALTAPVWAGTPTWIHSDLLRPNLLVRDGRMSAVIDFGGAGVGDPAMDVVAAWAVFGPAGRRVYRDRLGVDDGTWNRARGYALHQAAAIIPYYRDTNPAFVDLARRTIEQILLDPHAG